MSPRRVAVWPTLPLDVHWRRPSAWRPFPLDDDGCRIFSLARHALWQGCRALGLGTDDIVLAPAYHHGSEIEALIRAGVQIRYYELDDSLEPDAELLASLLGPRVRALYLIHYLGFPQDAARWRRWCDERGLFLIEDAAQAFLATRDGRSIGSFAHLAIFCLYKTYGIPDGGALIATVPTSRPTTPARARTSRLINRHVAWLAERRPEVGGVHLQLGRIVDWWRTRNELPQDEFELGDAFAPLSTASARLLPRLLDERTPDRRRENYGFLLTHLEEMVPPPFACLPDGASPFAFPIAVTDVHEFLRRLRRRGVVGLRFWLHPHPSLPIADFPRSNTLREHVLALPVHQELTRLELQHVVDAVRVCRAQRMWSHNAASPSPTREAAG
jgi:dTDP-4-amino-4,6-dideoxygalactose transaminase